MIDLLRKRFWIVAVIVLLASLGGIAGGFQIARGIIDRGAEDRLYTMASRFSANGDHINDETNRVLYQMNQSPFAYCSAEEREYFRSLIFHSAILKDGGHIRDGKVECSALIPASGLPTAPLHPLMVKREGQTIYADLGTLRNDSIKTFMKQIGSSYLIVSFPTDEETLTQDVQLIRSAVDTMGQIRGVVPGVPDWFFVHDGTRIYHGAIFATHCSTIYTHCVSAMQDLSPILQASRRQIQIYELLGGLVGGLLGLLGYFVFLNSLTLHRQLLHAIQEEAIFLDYQPLVEIGSGRIVGVEALARWTNLQGRVVSPAVFIPMAEEKGYIQQLTRLVLRRAMSDWKEYLQICPGFHLCINITAYDLIDPEFLPMLDGVLQSNGVDTQSVILEITESATARHGAIIEAIQKLRAAGHRIHIDDFGTGYSSLAYLYELNVDALKIDKVFTQAIGTGAVTANVLIQILAMAELLQLDVVAEGIETREQAEFFAKQPRSFLGQGWLYGKPVAPEEILSLLRNQGAAHAA